MGDGQFKFKKLGFQVSEPAPAEILSPVKISDCELLKAPVQSSFCRFWNLLMGGRLAPPLPSRSLSKRVFSRYLSACRRSSAAEFCAKVGWPLSDLVLNGPVLP